MPYSPPSARDARIAGPPWPSDEAGPMAGLRYRATRTRDRNGADVWGVAALEPRPGKPRRQVAWKTVGRDVQGLVRS